MSVGDVIHYTRWLQKTHERLHALCSGVVEINQQESTYTVGQINRTCLSIDNSAMVSSRKTCDTPKVSECCKE